MTTVKNEYTKYITRQDAELHIHTFIDDLSEQLEQLSLGKLGLSYQRSYDSLCPFDIQLLISEMKPTNNVELIVRNILLNQVINAEKLAPGSGFVVCIAFINALQSYNKQHDDDELIQCLDTISLSSHITTLDVLQSVLQKFLNNNKKICKMIIEACTLAGHDGSVYVNRLQKDASYIEQSTGYKFDCHPILEFWTTAKIKSWKRSNVKCFIIDGLIETVSEIHHLLESLSSSKSPGIIFARGFSEEVIATLSVNHKRKTLDVIPIQVPYDLQGMNMLKDLAVVCGSDVVSSLKGELISSIEFEKWPYIESISIDTSCVMIHHEENTQPVRAHVVDLIDRREKAVPDKANLLDLRIKSLTSGQVNIFLNHRHSEFSHLYVHRVETGVRLMSDIARSGIIQVVDNMQKHNIENKCGSVANNTFQKLYDMGFLTISANAIITGIRRGISAAESASSVGAFIIRDD
jgi:hypothetical protein